jgi:hypothetical protein
MQLASIVDQYADAFKANYAARLLPGHLKALDAIRRCRTPRAVRCRCVARNVTRQCGSLAPVGTAVVQRVSTMKPH